MKIDIGLMPQIQLFKNKPIIVPGEKIYEVLTSRHRHPIGVAVAQIRESVSHFHRRTREYYFVRRGRVEISAGGKRFEADSDSMVYIPPKTVHCARSLGDKAEVLVISVPAWRPKDHVLAEPRLRKK